MTATFYSGATLKCEIGWESNPSVALGSTSWTDETLKLRSAATSRGRDDLLDQFDAGSMSVVLSNADRRFDPNYSAGPLFGNLLPMRRVRFSATYNSTDYPIWCGFLDDLPQSYDIGGRDATVELRCTDGFKVLSLLNVPESVYAVEIPVDAPVGWWRLGESSGTTAVDSSGNDNDGIYLGGATFNSRTGLTFGGSDNAIGFDGVDDGMTAPSGLTAFPCSIECWFSSTATDGPLMQAPLIGGNAHVKLRLEGAQLIASKSAEGVSGALWSFTTTDDFNDGEIHHVVATFADGSSAPTVYVDGAAVDGSSSSLLSSHNLTSDVFVGWDGEPSPAYLAATIDEVAIYDVELDSTQVSDHYGFGTDPWAGDTSGERIGRLLDLAGWPSADRDIDTGISTMQAQALSGGAVLPLMQDIANSEQGQLFMGADGKVVFRDRHWRFENTLALTSQATFGDSGSELRYSDIQTDGGEALIFNRVRAGRDRGATVDLSDSTSITKFYERTEEITGLQNQSDLEVRDLANWRLATHANPIQRVTTLEIKPRKADQVTSLFPQVLGRDIGHRVTVMRRPQGVGTAITYVCLIEKVEHTILPDGTWDTRWYLSASDAQSGLQPLILDDTTYGILDTNVLAF